MSASMFRRAFLALVLAAGVATAFATGASAQSAKPQGFATPEAAADALTDAIRRDDSKAVGAILGSGWRDLVLGRPEDEAQLREKFLEAWDARHKVVVDGNKATIEAGTTGWTGPIPIVRDGDQWRFDTEAGRQEITARRIGRNELSVIQSLLALVDAQHDYAALDPMKVGAPVYARRLLSSPGQEGRTLLGYGPPASPKARSARRWQPRRRTGKAVRKMATTAIASACSTPRARMHPAVPTTIWSRIA